MGHGLTYLGILAILTALSSWFLATIESSLREDAARDGKMPTLSMDHFRATHMNAQGIRQYTLTAPHLVQLPEQQGTRLERPAMTVFQEDQVHDWIIHAESGWISPQNELIRLEGTVSIVRPATSRKRPVTITTRNLLLYPKEGYAETTEVARMETPGGMVTTVGLKAYLHKEQLELLSEVRGHYEPPKP